MSFRDLTGQRFGQLNVIEYTGRKRHRRPVWKCVCDCGNEHETYTDALTKGKAKSCGCLNRSSASERMKKVQLLTHTHDMSTTRFYTCWRSMKARCDNKKSSVYKNYGGRGITYCDRWETFEKFKDDMYPSYLQATEINDEKEITLERKEVNGNYNFDNCSWVTKAKQARNRRSNNLHEYNGQKLPLITISEIVAIPYQTLAKRIYAGWEFNDAISRPVEVRCRSKSHA